MRYMVHPLDTAFKVRSKLSQSGLIERRASHSQQLSSPLKQLVSLKIMSAVGGGKSHTLYERCVTFGNAVGSSRGDSNGLLGPLQSGIKIARPIEHISE